MVGQADPLERDEILGIGIGVHHRQRFFDVEHRCEHLPEPSRVADQRREGIDALHLRRQEMVPAHRVAAVVPVNPSASEAIETDLTGVRKQVQIGQVSR